MTASPRIVASVVALALAAGLAAAVLAPSERESLVAAGASPRSGADGRAKLPPGRPLTIAWGGDVTLGSSYGLPPDHGRGMLDAVASFTRRADIAAVNLEGTFGQGGAPKCAPGASPTCFAFQAPAANAQVLRSAGVDVVNLANNHAWDFGAEGMGQTVLALRRHHVKLTGRPWEITVLRTQDARVAFVGFSAYRWTSPIRDLAAARQIVRAAALSANVVVVLIHAGGEGQTQTRTPDADEQAFGEARGNSRAFAHAAVDAGADLVLGSGPHVLRGMEVYRGRLVAYSLGNLAGWHNFATSGASRLSGLLQVRIGRRGQLRSGRLRSLSLVGAGVPRADRSRAAVALVRRISAEDFGGRAARLSPAGAITPP